jgi:NADH-quinone oxidoreductase subunit M
MSTSLLLLLLIPLLGAILCPMLPSGAIARGWALAISLATLGIAIVLGFARGGTGAAVFAPHGWTVAGVNFGFSLGCDSISYWLVLLTAGLQPLAIAASFASIRERQREYYAWMLALLVAMLGVFVARDVLLFYVFFELTLIPMFFIIGLWGGPERRYAAAKFFLFTFAGGVFTLAAAVYVGVRAGSFDLATCVNFAQTQMSHTERYWLLLGFLAGFAVKVPLFPVHTWLPLAHTEAPTAGSVILAGVLLKLGTYGLLRLAVPIGLVGLMGAYWMPTVMWCLGILCVVGVIYGALVAWVQQDIKKLVAYSSVSHLGFCVLGLLALNQIGIQGSILYMINHGISTGAMFLVIGMIYDRFHTRDINALSGLARRMPVMSFFFVFFVLSSIGLPGLNGFVSEFLTILGAFVSDHLGIAFGAVAATGIVLGAVYMLHMTAKVIFGPLKFPGSADEHGGGHGHAAHAEGHGADDDDDHVELPRDLSGREVAILIPLALAAIILGVRPGIIMDDVAKGVEDIRTAAVSNEAPTRMSPPAMQREVASTADDKGQMTKDN